MLREPKEVNVKILDLEPDLVGNYRDELNIESSYEIKPMLNDLVFRGQMEALVLVKRPDGKLKTIKGNRRVSALLAIVNSVNPETGGPYIDPKTGKPFETARAKIYENLSPAEEAMLRLDHGQVKELNKMELFKAYVDVKTSGLTDLDFVKMARRLMERHFPFRKPVADSDAARLDNWKGAIQPMTWAFQSPDLLSEAYKNKLRGTQSWPTKSELGEGKRIFETEIGNDRAHKFSKSNPGPEWMKWWNEYSTKKLSEEASGNSPKPASMMNRTDVENVQKNATSRIIKIYVDFQLRKIDQTRLAAFDKLVAEIEDATLNGKGVTPEQTGKWNAILDEIIGSAPPAAETTETETETETKTEPTAA